MADKKPANTRSRRARLGQHFLRDSAAAARIVEALGEIRDSTVVEIGAGRGALTALLAPRARRLIAIELDRALAAQLRMQYARQSSVEIIEGDVLHVDFSRLVARRPAPLMTNSIPVVGQQHERARVVGNLPYYIASPILLRLLADQRWLETMVLMVQREVAERMAAAPGSRDYGLLSATVQFFARVERLFTLPPAAFAPPPKVHSSVLRLTLAPQAQALGVEPEAFVKFLKHAFAQKRKTLANNLKPHYSQPVLRSGFARARIPAQVRAEALSLAQMARLFTSLTAAGG